VAIDGATLPFAVSPGMTARADIRTGSRTLAEYLLSPILRHVRDSLKER
jgi:hemolysin D